MCYNYRPPTQYQKRQFSLADLKIAVRNKPVFSLYYSNGFNHEELPVITMDKPDALQFYSWGLVPSFIKDIQGAREISNKTLNARSETVFTTASYKLSIQDKRCLVLAEGFNEWHTVGKEKYPYHIQVLNDDFPDENRVFCFAGIYNHWVDKSTGEILHTFSILTTPANSLLEFVHNSAKRMPLILSQEDEAKWIDPTINYEDLEKLMRPYPSDKMIAYSISKLITSRKQEPNDPKVLEGFDYNLSEVPSIIHN